MLPNGVWIAPRKGTSASSTLLGFTRYVLKKETLREASIGFHEIIAGPLPFAFPR